MVFFTCNHCGESVKKPAVEKHYSYKCRGAPVSVSCMDCMKDFHEEAYVAHTKCITEAEKYSGKEYVPKESKNNGAKKQESWMDIIRSILETSEYDLSAQARSAFQRLQTVDNVPRKKAKFQNFVSNCMRMPSRQAEEVWNVLEKELKKIAIAKQEETAAAKAAKTVAVTTNGATKPSENGNKSKDKENKDAKKVAKRNSMACNGDEAPVAKKPKQQKTEAAVAAEKQEVAVDAENGDEVFAWSDALKKVVVKHAEGIAVDKLKKKLLKKYSAKLGLADAMTEKQQKKFEKKFTKNLKKCAELQLENDVVRCC